MDTASVLFDLSFGRIDHTAGKQPGRTGNQQPPSPHGLYIGRLILRKHEVLAGLSFSYNELGGKLVHARRLCDFQ